MANAILYLLNPGETIHFRLDTNTRGDGWQPAANAVACSHFTIMIPGYEFELVDPSESYQDDLSAMVLKPSSPSRLRYRKRR